MCKHGSYKMLKVRCSNKEEVPIDLCIYDEIDFLNFMQVETIACCCGHGKAGQIEEYSNGFGKWKERILPPHALIKESSVSKVLELGYVVCPYYYADGEHDGTYILYLRTGELKLKEEEVK